MLLTLRITLQQPPANLTYALQKGSASKCELVQMQQSTGGDLYFELTAELKGNKQAKALPDFKGPFVQGPASGRFIYLTLGSYAGGDNLYSGRIKVPLTGINWDLAEKSAGILQTTVPGTGKNGRPTYATVKPFEGWSIGK